MANLSMLKFKSGMLAKLAQELINHSWFTQSVHCSYYSALQMMKYTLACYKDTSMRISLENQEIQSRGKSSHLYLEEKILERVSSPRERTTLRERISFLKNERVAADYTDRNFESEEAIDCIDASKAIKGLLEKMV